MNEINMIVRANAIGIPLLAIIQGGIATLGYYLFDAPSAVCLVSLPALPPSFLLWEQPLYGFP